jgi:succinate-semialdehyde dehydrogenase/glutarate-semialdehyde dehydrogenase
MTPKSNASILRSLNPATLEVVGEVAVTHPKDVESIVQTAREGFPDWRNLGLDGRILVLKNAQRLLLERTDEFARLITLEMGRPYVESVVMELEASIDLVGYYARRAPKYLKDKTVPLHNLFFKRRRSRIHFEPLGVIGVIAPWNWPLLIPLGFIAPGLLAGNAVVFKHSELTPLMAEKIRGLFLDAGVPESALQIVQGRGEAGAALVDSSVDRIFFTGSTDVGQKVMERASRSLKKAVLELGGSDPAIVCGDADIAVASSGVAWGGFNNCGQNCNSVERVYVHEKIASRFVEAVVEKAERLRVGNGMNPDVDLGPLASESQRTKIESIVRRAAAKGGKILCGGKCPAGLKGYFFEPTVILWDKTNPAPAPSDEEIFGPLLYVTPVADDDEAVRLANASCFGLAASVWTADGRRGERIARRIEAGSVMVNDAVVSFGIAEAGWTGVKKSGAGWVHGEKGLEEMVNIQYVNREPQSRMQKFWWFPYSEGMVQGMKAGLTFLFHRGIVKRTAAIPSALRHFTAYLLLNRRRKDKL